MARLNTTGWEVENLASEPGITVFGLPEVSTTIKRTGSASLRTPSIGGAPMAYWTVTGVSTRAYYWRAYVHVETLPTTATAETMYVQGAANRLAWFAFNAAGTIDLRQRNAAGVTSTLATSGAVLTAGGSQWVRLELGIMVNTTASAADYIEARIDGTSLFSDSATDRWADLPAGFRHGNENGDGCDIYWDDCALNDDQGADQNSWPGTGAVALLVPTADSARTGWTDNAAGTTDLWQALDNTPPVGEGPAGFSVVNSGGSSGNVTTSDTATLPALATNDVVLVFAINGGANADLTVSDNSGTGSYTQEQLIDITGTGRAQLWWKRASGAAGTSTLTISGATNSLAHGWEVLRGVSTDADPFDVASSAVAVTSARSGIAAGITTTTAGCRIIACVGSDDNIDTSAMALVNGPTLTSRGAGTSAGGVDTQAELWDGTQGAAGATGNFSFTNAAAAGIGHGIIVAALKPATPAATVQIRDAAASATDDYDATMQTYTAGGVSGTVNVVQAVANVGNETTTAINGATKIVSNPAEGSETSFAYPTTVASAFPSNWSTKVGPVVYAPSVTLGTAPVLRVGKRTANAAAVLVDLLGIYVDYVPGAAAASMPPALSFVDASSLYSR